MFHVLRTKIPLIGLKRMQSSLSSATYDAIQQHIEVRWRDVPHKVLNYSALWMRDNCKCSECYDPVSNMRLFEIYNLDMNLKPSSLKIVESNQALNVTWSDGHTSKFDSDWLISHDFDYEPQNFKLSPILWGSEMIDSLPIFQYDKFIEDDQTLYEFLISLEKFGLAKIQNASTNESVIENLGERLGDLLSTHYGSIFRVEIKPNATNLAYTSNNVTLHTDLPYMRRPAGIQCLHYASQPESMVGGENVFVDGFTVANDLKINDKESYDILTKQLVDFRIIGDDAYKYHIHHQQPVISLKGGQVLAVTYSDALRDSQFNIKSDETHEFYRALCKFNSRLYNSRNLLCLKPNEGDIIIFDNVRALHGRKPYKIENKHEGRLLIGAYIEWDHLIAKRIMLSKQFV